MHNGYIMKISGFPSDYVSSKFLLSDSRSVICKSSSSVNLSTSWQQISTQIGTNICKPKQSSLLAKSKESPQRKICHLPFIFIVVYIIPS